MKLMQQYWQQNQIANQSQKFQVMLSLGKNLAPSFENPKENYQKLEGNCMALEQF